MLASDEWFRPVLNELRLAGFGSRFQGRARAVQRRLAWSVLHQGRRCGSGQPLHTRNKLIEIVEQHIAATVSANGSRPSNPGSLALARNRCALRRGRHRPPSSRTRHSARRNAWSVEERHWAPELREHALRVRGVDGCGSCADQHLVSSGEAGIQIEDEQRLASLEAELSHLPRTRVLGD